MATPEEDFYHHMVVQHLAIESANKSVDLARLQARVAVMLRTWEGLRIDPEAMAPEDQEALVRFLAALDALR